jgi:TRAP-type mannitol/chloroaromatic compound transport system permease small subunit
MRKLLQIVEHIIEQVGELGLVISGILTLVMALLSTYGVGRRYLLNNPEPYSYELSTMFLVACIVFAVAGLQRHGRHLRVDFISNYFPPSVQSVLLNIITPIFALFYVVIITWQSCENALYSMKIKEMSQSSWQEPLFPIKLFVPIGMALLCLVLIAQLSHGIASLTRIIKKKQS